MFKKQYRCLYMFCLLGWKHRSQYRCNHSFSPFRYAEEILKKAQKKRNLKKLRNEWTYFYIADAINFVENKTRLMLNLFFFFFFFFSTTQYILEIILLVTSESAVKSESLIERLYILPKICHPINQSFRSIFQ